MKSCSIRPVKDIAVFQPTTINNKSAQKNNKPALFMRWILMLLMMCTTGAYAQFAVTTNGGSGLAGTYPSLAAAITALNGATITAPVVITCPTGTETAPLSGYSITATGTVTNTITIQGNGAANSIITAFSPQTVGSKSDAVIKIIGGDFITIQGFKMQENTANVAASALATNNETEFGVALFATTTTNGAQNNTIQNNTITLSNPTVSYQNAIGIFSTTASSSTNGAQAATSTAGTNSNNKFYSNIISGVAQGLYFISVAQTATIFESGNDIGGTSGATGNTITFGVSNTAGDLGFTSYSGATAAGVYFRNVVGNSVRFNTINSTATLTLGCAGIFTANGTNPTGVTYTSTASDNNITITNVGTTIINAIDFGSGLATGTIIGSNNTIVINQNATAAVSPRVAGIFAGYVAATNTCSGNNITINMTQTTGATTSNTFGIDQSAAATTITANSNTITFNESTSGTGTIGGAPIVGLNPTGAATTINVLTNTILINQTTSVASGIGNVLTGIKAAAAATTLNITTNNSITIKQAVTGSGSYGSGAITFINANATHGTANITGNNLNTTGSTIRSTGALIGVFQDATVTTLVNVKNNSMIVDRVATSGSIIFQSTSGTPSEVADTLSNNIITFTSLAGTTSATAISSLGGPSSPVANNKSIANNTISISGTSSGAMLGIGCTFTNAGFIKGNSVSISSASASNTGISSTSTATGMTITGNSISLASSSVTQTDMTAIAAAGSTGAFAINNNNITSLAVSAVGTSAPIVLGIAYTGTTSSAVSISNNAVSGISIGAAGSVGSPVISAISAAGGTLTISKNRVCSVATLFNGGSTLISGLRITGSAGTSVISNNRIADLNASAAVSAECIRGINITSSSTTTTLNVYYNTVYISSAAAAGTFGTTGLFHTVSTTATTATLDLRNNIIVNTSSAAGAGLTVAYRRSAGAATNLANYASTSNRNLFYAGAPGASNLIYSDGTGSAQTIAAYKSGVFTAGTIAPRDANSVTENPPFLSTTCGNANFLKINTATPTGAESGGATVAGVTDDFEGDTRGGTPDIGADEFAGTPLPNCSGTPASSTINGAASVCTGTGTTLSLSTIYTDLGISYQWRSSLTPGGPYSTTLGTNATQATGNLTSTTYYICDITCSFSALTFTTAEKTVAVNALPTVGVTPTSGSYCTPGGTAVTLNGSGASTYAWAPASGLDATTGTTVHASPSSTTVYTVTGTDANGCINTATSTITVAAAPVNVTATATPSNICSGTTSSLTSSGYSPNPATLPAGYTMAGTAGTYTTITGTSAGGAIGDDFAAGNLPIGFTFNYNGVGQTVFAAASNGFIELGSTLSYTSNSGAGWTPSTNALTGRANILAPLWDDNNTTGGTVIYATTGSVGSRVLTVQWTGMHVGNTGGGSQPTINVQVKLYEGSNKIEFVYGTTSAALTSTTASIGISGAVGNYLSVTPASPVTSTTASNASENTGISSATLFPSGTVYTFAPPSVALSYAWTAVTNLVSPSTQNTATTALTATETFTVTVTNGGCSTTATATVTVSPLTAASITLTGSQCANTNFTATANTTGGSPTYHYAWSDGVGGVYPDAQTVTVNKPAGSYTLSVTVTDGCGGSVPMTLPVTVNALPTVTITPTPGTARICGTGSVSMLAGGASTYVWTPTTSLTPSNGLSATEVSAATTTTGYTVTGTDGNGCVGTATQTVTVGPAVSFSSVTASPSTICSGQTSALNAVAITTPSSNYSVASITPTAETPSGSPTVLITGGVATPTPGGFPSALTDDGYWDGITLPFSFNYFGTAYSTVRIAINGNVQFGVVQSTGRNPGNSSYQTQTIPTGGAIGASNYLDNFIGGPLIDQDPGSTPFGTIRYFTNGVSPNRKFVISYESVHVFSSADNNTSQIILNENGTIDVLLLGGGLTSTASKVIGIENAGGSLGVAAPGRNTGTWTTAADEAWRFTPPALNYAWTPATGLAPSDVVSNPTTPALTSTTTYTVTATEPVSGCSATGNVTVTIGTANITATAGTGGSISPNGLTTINCGLNQAYTISPDACHTIADVVVDGVSQGAVSSYTFTNVTAGAHTIVASFNIITYAITVTAGTGGSITPGTGSVNCGDNATYTITADACHTLTDVVVDGVSQGAVGTYTFTNVTATHTISATFSLNTYLITVTAGANGSVTPGTGSVNCGTNATYTITPNACYSIADVVVDGVSQGAVGTYTFTNVTAAHSISATFVLNTYTITVTAGANGSITPATGSVNCGDNATYTITANACYSIADVVVDGISQGAVGTYTFTNITANHTISATFVLNTYTITVTAGANGSITPATGSVNCGDNATYTITANACYSIADVVVDGVSQGAVGTYTFTNVTAAHTISASFVLNTYTITVTAGANGSIAPATGSVNCGDNATYTITPDACFAIADVVVDGVSQGAVGTYTFTNVTAAHSISATFIETNYTITVTAGANGSITPGTGSVNCGSNATYTITPDACYSIADVVVDAVSQGAVGTYTFTNVTANHTISATFVLNTYTITVTAGANGSITPPTGSVNCGDNATYTITADACYSIADVVVDGVSQGAVGTYTFTNVTAAHTISASFVLNTYTITVTAGANGSITPATGSVNCGDNATYTITPNACYAIADVVVDGVSQGAVGTYTFTNVTAAHTISATFALTNYTITVTAGANGSITPATGSVNCGDNATYTITANACYSIADVVVDGVSQGALGTYTFTNVTANHTISATFVLTNYTITVTAGANGSITPATGSVNCGDNATYTITADACYSIADVVVDGVSQGAVGTYTFTNVTANHTISASFVLNTYTITVTAGANGSITPSTGSVNCGDNATYTITPNACYSIADVVVDGVSQGAVGTYTFTNVTAAHTISATFVLNTYTITVTAGANGSITPATGSVNCGDNATYTITANACYSIADVVVDGVSQGAVGTYTFTNVTANHTISATFTLNTYTITVTAGSNGSITPATGSVNCGDNATYTITPNACYAIADVIVDGVSQGAVGTHTFTNVTANHTISATFVLTNYTITVTAGANGSITPATGSVNCGDNATYTITADACYSIADVVVDGVSQGAVGTYAFTNVTANHTISATFVLNTYTITVTAGANGSITPATGSVNCGDNATYTITPNACYSIADVVVDGVSQGALGTYTFTNVTANHTISATFVLNTYTITVTAGANGSITPATGSVNCGANATYTITPNACYSITDVVVDGVSQGALGTYTFTNVTANHTISATFVLNTYTITVTAGANGSITPGTGSVNCGTNATYTITPNGGFAIADVVVDGSSQGAIGSFTFTGVTANHTISATFVNNASFTITSSAGPNGSISPNGATSVASGGSQAYTITPIACYHVADVLVDGVSVGAVTTYTFTNVTANHTISATFAINAALTVSVSGPVNVCPYVGTGDPVVYTATSAGATGFTWVVPPNVSIVSGQGTATLTVTFGIGFTAAQPNKQLRVTALSPCGNSAQFIYYLAVQTPNTPQPIVASSTNVCAVIGTAGTITYTIPSVAGATSYNWSAQAGTTTINHPNGAGVNDTTVTVSFTLGFTSSNITVSATSPCLTSGARSLAITRSNPSTPGLIGGPTNACPFMAPGGTVATYSVTNTPGNTYTWTVPAGAIGLTGQGTNTISFTYPNTFVSGSITVFATNGCGSSSTRSLSISKLAPATPSVIDVIQTQPCPNREFTYTLSGMPANATSVQWTVPAGATIVSGQGTISITVSYSPAAFNSSVTAQAFNNCGSSTIRSTTVHIPACPLERTTITKGGSNVTTPSVESMLVNVYPNPTVNDFKLQVTTAGKEAINVRILDLQGRALKSFVVSAYQTTTVGSDLKAGTYMVEVRQGNNVKVTKLIKF